MARQSKDPYGDFVVRIINSCRIAANQAFGMSDDEYFRVMKVHELMTTLDPDAQRVRKASVPIVIPTHGVKMGRVWRIPIREVERLEREWRLSARAS